jgi:hypothetical protein
MKPVPFTSITPIIFITSVIFITSIFITSMIILVDCHQVTWALDTQNTCLSCHMGLKPELSQYARQWAESVHSSVPVFCEECHGGNPYSSRPPRVGKDGFIGKPSKQAIPVICNRCHADIVYMQKHNIRVDEESQYTNSVHGQQLLKKNNPDVPSCVDCHGSHDIRKPDDPKSTVNHYHVADTCARCHAASNRMKPYGLPADQLTQYKKSYHGRILYQQIKGKNPRLVPSCPGCHGIHEGKPAGGGTQVSDACYNCHLNIKRYFQKSIHSLLLKKNHKPRCIDCHGYHDIPYPGEDLLAGESTSHCGNCHSLQSSEYQNGLKFRALIKQAKKIAEKSQGRINKIKKDLDIDTSCLNLKMDDALQTLDEAVKATHSQDVQTVSQIIQDAYKHLNTIDQQISLLYQEIRQRKQWLARVLLLICAAFSLAAYQRYRLKKY